MQPRRRKLNKQKLNYKRKNKLEFFEQKWFKLVCLFAFFGWLFYMTHTPFEINKEELMELNVTVNGKWKSGGHRNPIKIYFKTKEYSNQFGIYVGGIFGKWTEVTNSLEHNNRIVIRIHKDNKKNLNIATEVIPIYYLKSDKSGLVFNENKFNEGEKSSDNRVLWLFIILFIISLWRILTD